MDIPIRFRLNCTQHGDFRKLKTLLRIILRSYENEETKSYEEKLDEELGGIETWDDYEKDYPLDADPWIFKHNYTFFMKEKDIKKLPSEERELPTPKEKIDLEKAERVYLTNEQIRKKIKEEEEAFMKSL